MASKDVEKLIGILTKLKNKYNEKQMKAAILSEGYSEDIAKQVLDKIYSKDANTVNNSKIEQTNEKPIERNREQKPEVKEIVKEAPKEQKEFVSEKDSNYYKEVDYLLNELRGINSVKKQELDSPNLLKETTQTNISLNSDVNSQIEAKKLELSKIKIESNDDNKIIDKNGKIIDLNDYPRREWRNYRDSGKSLAESKEEQIKKLRQDIYALKKQAGRGQEVIQEQNISEKIKERVRNKVHGRVPDNKIEVAAISEAEKLRDKYKSDVIEKQDLDVAADNIYIQMIKNPNIYGDEENKPENEPADNKQNNISARLNKAGKPKANDELNLDMDMNSNSDLNTNLDEDFNLGLDLNANLDDKKKKK